MNQVTKQAASNKATESSNQPINQAASNQEIESNNQPNNQSSSKKWTKQSSNHKYQWARATAARARSDMINICSNLFACKRPQLQQEIFSTFFFKIWWNFFSRPRGTLLDIVAEWRAPWAPLLRTIGGYALYLLSIRWTQPLCGQRFHYLSGGKCSI